MVSSIEENVSNLLKELVFVVERRSESFVGNSYFHSCSSKLEIETRLEKKPETRMLS